MTGIEEALALIGNATALGRKLVPPVTRQAVAEWVKRGWVPSERAAQISAITGVDTDRLVKPSLVRAVKGTRPQARITHHTGYTAASQKGTIMEVSDADRRKEWSTSQSGMTQTVGTDADIIGVPRSVLAAACYIIRNSEHAESETAKAMRKYALSTQTAELDALRGEVFQ